MTTTAHIEGTVKWFDQNKGYGFIVREDQGKDVFVHITDVRKSGLNPDDFGEGDKVTFSIETGDRGLKAVELSII